MALDLGWPSVGFVWVDCGEGKVLAPRFAPVPLSSQGITVQPSKSVKTQEKRQMTFSKDVMSITGGTELLFRCSDYVSTQAV